MSAIHKLSIQGIRSFDSNDRETIEFGAPLTLIVGMNGSGKTTIIECLKYATTGNLPPNSKGGVFVHDPKITGEKDVRAQVKLAFTSANGLTMIVTRNIQLLMKRTTTTFKTLEGQLVVINKNSDRSTLSTKSVELDTQVPLYMGVPKAILDYVIFCHQEDSLWPLSEPANLKKKFDEIFQALKFTKAIDNLKVIKKDMAVDIKLLRQSVEHLKIDRDRSKSTKMKIHQLEAKIDQYQDQVNDLELKIQDINRQSDTLFKTNQNFQEILSKVDNLSMMQTMTLEDIERLSSTIDILDLPEDKIKDLLENFSNTLKDKETEINKLEEALFSLNDSLSHISEQKEDLIREEAELNSKLQINNDNLEKINVIMMDMDSKYGFEIDETVDGASVLEGIEDLLNTMKGKLDKLKTEFKSIVDAKEKEVADKVYSETVQTQKLEYSRRDNEKLLKDIDSLEAELRTKKSSEEELNKEKQSLDEYDKQLFDFEKENNQSNVAALMKQKNEAMLIAENEIEQIQEKILKTNQQTDLFAKLGLIKSNLQKKQGTIDNISDTLNNDPKFKELELSLKDTIDLDFKTYFISLQKQIALSNRDLNQQQKLHTEALYHLNTLNEQEDNDNKTLNAITKRLEEKLPEDCAIDEYDDAIIEAEVSYKTAVENLKMHQTTLEFNRKALQIAETDSCCYLCSRKFETPEFKSKLLTELKKKTAVGFENTLRETVEEESRYITELRACEKDIIAFNNLKEKIKSTHSNISMAQEKVTKLDGTLLECQNFNKNLKLKSEYLENSIRRKIEQYVDIKKDIKQLQNESQTMTEELKIYSDSTGLVQTVDELRISQKETNDCLRKLRKEINEIQEDRELKSKKHTALLNIIKEKNMNIRDIENSLNQYKNIDNEIRAKKEEVENIIKRISSLEIEVNNITNERKDLEHSLTYDKDKYQRKIDNESSEFEALYRIKDTLKDLVSKVDQFEHAHSSNTDKIKESIEHIESEIMEKKKQIEIRSNQINDEKQRLKDSNGERRNLKENLELIGLRRKFEDINREIELSDVGNAEAERDEYQRKSAELRSEYEKLSAENAGKLGEMKQLQNQIDSLSQLLRSDYKDVDEKFHKEWVELQARTFVTDDIDTYSRALDSAIMKYHGLKMEDINRIIDELWKRTYSGTDIDTIKIRSDEVSSTARGKSYNYRVVMFKQDAELDMRGRCSAGQKVLASIIIRLALSETFGVNCGVIALDEPTTNLDEENIESLAKSLHNIIEMRKHQKNFQLIVITHDEKFLNHMNASQFTDHFFKVKRDDRQKSQIEWVDINRVSEY